MVELFCLKKNAIAVRTEWDSPYIAVDRDIRSCVCLAVFVQAQVKLSENSIKHKTVKTNDKIRRFGVVTTPLSRKMYVIMQITAFKAIFGAKN